MDSNSFLFLDMDISAIFLIILLLGDIPPFNIWYCKYDTLS